MTTLQQVFVALPAILMLLWLIVTARGPRKIDVPGTTTVLRYGAALRTLTLVVAMLLPMIMIYIIAVLPWNRNPRLGRLGASLPWGSDELLACAGSAYLVTCLIAGIAFVEVARSLVCVSEEGVTRLSPWRGRAALNWNEVESVHYSSLNSVFVVTGAGRRIGVSRYLVGVNVFADTVKRKLATERFRPALKALDAIR